MTLSNRSFGLFLAGIFVVALGVRLGAVGQRELWMDERFSVVMTQVPEGIWSSTRNPQGMDGNNPPLYYFLLQGWTARFGISEAGVRSLSILAGLLHLAVLAAAAHALGFGRRAIVLVLALGAMASLHVFYSVEGRAYMWLLFLLTAALAAYLRGVRGGGIWPWVLHGLAMAAAAYTHAVAFPFLAAFWLALPFLDRRPGAWRRLAVSHLGVLLLYIPWIPVLVGTGGHDGRVWIAYFMDDDPQALLAPRTLEVFGVGGKLPDYLELFPPVHPAVRVLSIAVFATAGIAALAYGFRRSGRAAPEAPRRAVAPLLVFLLFPIFYLYLHSNLREPLYLIGRYDLPALPAYLLLVGLGLDRLVAWAPRRRQGMALGAALLVLAAFGAYAHRNAVFHPALRSAGGSHTERGEILARYVAPEDVIVCTGHTTPSTWYELLHRNLPVRLVTFPFSQLQHMGWFHAPATLREESTARQDARVIVGWIADDPPAHRILWCMVPDRLHDPEGYAVILEWLLTEVRARRCHLVFPEGEEVRWRELGIYPIAPAGTAALMPR